MAFMTLKLMVFKNKRKFLNIEFLFFFSIFAVGDEASLRNQAFFKEFTMNSLASTQVFRKRVR